MYTIVYDGSWAGLLTSVFEIYANKLAVNSFQTQQVPTNKDLFNPVFIVQTDQAKALRVWKGLTQKISTQACSNLYQFFLSEEKHVEVIFLRYVEYVFSKSVTVENDFTNKAVFTVNAIARKVSREKHRMKAFVRFSLTKDGLYYAIVEPDYNVLPLIAKHFKERYADQRWLIFDVCRQYGIYYDLNTVTEVTIDFNHAKETEDIFDDDEILFQQLWKVYFKSVNIPARKNTKLHIQHMPKRYWKYLTEKKYFQ